MNFITKYEKKTHSDKTLRINKSEDTRREIVIDTRLSIYNI
jgi:hypothetical protein